MRVVNSQRAMVQRAISETQTTSKPNKNRLHHLTKYFEEADYVLEARPLY